MYQVLHAHLYIFLPVTLVDSTPFYVHTRIVIKVEIGTLEDEDHAHAESIQLSSEKMNRMAQYRYTISSYGIMFLKQFQRMCVQN